LALKLSKKELQRPLIQANKAFKKSISFARHCRAFFRRLAAGKHSGAQRTVIFLQSFPAILLALNSLLSGGHHDRDAFLLLLPSPSSQ
jgi:hypothetical protein